MTVYDIIKQLENETSTNKKLEILKANKDNQELREFFRLALNSEDIFYIKKIPEYEFQHSGNTLSACFGYLENLSNRTYTGNEGISFLKSVLESTSKENANLIERVIKKDPSCKVSENTVNKVWKKLINIFPVALCERNNVKTRKNISFPAYAQDKEDGIRFCTIVEDGQVSFRSRNGKLIDLLGCLEKEFISLANGKSFMFDGEAVCYDSDGNLLLRKTSNGILNKAIKGTISLGEAKMVHVVLWDMIPLEYFWEGKCLIPYEERLYNLETNYKWGDTFHSKILTSCTIDINSWEEAEEIFADVLADGREGIIVKERSSVWENKRLKNHIKLKAEKSADLLCVGTVPHSKNPDMIGSLILVTSCGKLECGCGSGLSDKDRLKGTDYYLDKVVEVKYNEVITNEEGGTSLFLPIYKKVRLDKTGANSLEEFT